jgi:hypothetical protein
MPNSHTLSEMVPQQRPAMPIDLYRAVIKGEADVLVPRLGLPCNHIQVNICTLGEFYKITFFANIYMYINQDTLSKNL